jgi:dienelactone hydrolase
MHPPLITILVIVLIGLSGVATAAQPAKPPFPPVDQLPVVKDLPDPFVFNDGTRVTSREQWPKRREELQAMILYYEYGEMPPAPGNTVGVELVSGSSKAGPGAVHRVFKLTCGPENKVTINLELTIPSTKGNKGPFPAIICGDLGWGRVPDEITAEIIKRGYILADFNRTELAPDSKTGYKSTGLYTAYPDADCGAVAAWAWGFQRCVDFLLTLDYVDKEKITITGHSRGGKAAILAGATDTRVALTAPNGSGCGGAGSFKYQAPKSEDIAAITKNFPFWFAPRFTSFVGHIDRLPFDQHELKALCAPHAFFETEALGDLWANPEGSRQTYLAAREVYKFLGVPEKIGISYREGKHEHTAEDWNAMLDFADQVYFGKKASRSFDPNPFPNTPKTFEWTAPASPQ